MKLDLFRYSDSGESTLGLLFINNVFECYTIEDTYRDKKVYGQTRIPQGAYEIGLRTVGGFHERYMRKFGGFHKGTLHLKDVPGYKYILMHVGNSAHDTKGCLLVGNKPNNNQIAPGFLGDSTNAYRRMYRKVSRAILQSRAPGANFKVQIQISDFERLQKTHNFVETGGVL